jgi:hypothetical protein
MWSLLNAFLAGLMLGLGFSDMAQGKSPQLKIFAAAMNAIAVAGRVAQL